MSKFTVDAANAASYYLWQLEALMGDENKVRVQVMLDPEILRRVDELAELLGGTRSGVTAKLIEEALNDNEWMLRHIVAPMRRIVEGWRARTKKQSE